VLLEAKDGSWNVEASTFQEPSLASSNTNTNIPPHATQNDEVLNVLPNNAHEPSLETDSQKGIDTPSAQVSSNYVSSLLESLFSPTSNEISYPVNPSPMTPNAVQAAHWVQAQSVQTIATHSEITHLATFESDPRWRKESGWGEVDVDNALELLTGIPVEDNYESTYDPMNVLGFKAAWAHGYTGKGVVIANIDTGIDLTNSQLISNIRLSAHSWNFINQTNNVQDDNGHGTITAQELVAGPNFDDLIDGGAYDAELMVLKALDASGKGTDASVSQAIVYAVDHGASIINLSLGQNTPDASLFSALQYANEHGVIVAAAAGNNGSDSVNYPAAYAKIFPNVIAVGATQYTQGSLSMSAFSNHAGADTPYNFVNATGVDVLGIGLNGQEGYWSGTSMATPFVSAEAAILKQAKPNASAIEIVQAITNSAQSISLSVAGLHIDLATTGTQSNAQNKYSAGASSYHTDSLSTHFASYVPTEQYV